MNTSTKNNLFLTLVIVSVMTILLYDHWNGFSMKSVSMTFLFFVALWYEYNRGYNTGKAYYTEPNPDHVIEQSKDWDHRLTLQEVLAEHPFCIMELDHAPCQEHDYPLPSGHIHLVQNSKHYTTLTLLDDGWTYSADTSFGKDVLNSAKYKPMLTHEAIKISQDKIWDIYF